MAPEDSTPSDDMVKRDKGDHNVDGYQAQPSTDVDIPGTPSTCGYPTICIAHALDDVFGWLTCLTLAICARLRDELFWAARTSHPFVKNLWVLKKV